LGLAGGGFEQLGRWAGEGADVHVVVVFPAWGARGSPRRWYREIGRGRCAGTESIGSSTSPGECEWPRIQVCRVLAPPILVRNAGPK
jgi:hypothetical protein